MRNLEDMVNSLRQMTYLEQVAKRCFDKYGDNFYEALNAAECIVRSTDDPEGDAQRVHAILEGEV